MSHGGHLSLPQRSGWMRWLNLFSGGGAWLCGAIGALVNEAHEGALWNHGIENIVNSVLFSAYTGLQLLLGHAHEAYVSDVNGWLIIGRVLAIVFIVDMGLQAYFVIFRNEWQARRAQSRRRRGHVLVCGLGDLGLRIALEARRKGKVVVAVEERSQAENIERARSHGVLVIEGNATVPAVMKRVHAEQADVVLATCREDHTNVAIAVAVGGLVAASPPRERPLLCRLVIENVELRDLLVDKSHFTFGGNADGQRQSQYRVNCNDLDFHHTAARQALGKHPLDFEPIRRNDLTQVHLVVIGFGAMGRSLALHAARIGHFANRVDHGIKIHITIVDPEAEKLVADFKRRQIQIDEICELSAWQADPTGADFLDSLIKTTTEQNGRPQLITYAVCFETHRGADGALNVRIGAGLARRTKDCPVQTLVYAGIYRGFASLLEGENKGTDLNPQLYPFGMPEDVYTWDALLHESLDTVARALHEEFQNKQRQLGAPDEENPGWEQLPESLMASNRDAADHIPIKVRALGYHIERLQHGRPRVENLDARQVELLARMEHFRWCAERWLSGWQYAEQKDRNHKKNPNLVPWDQLLPDEQQKDPDQVQAIIRALKHDGQGVYR